MPSPFIILSVGKKKKKRTGGCFCKRSKWMKRVSRVLITYLGSGLKCQCSCSASEKLKCFSGVWLGKGRYSKKCELLRIHFCKPTTPCQVSSRDDAGGGMGNRGWGVGGDGGDGWCRSFRLGWSPRQSQEAGELVFPGVFPQDPKQPTQCPAFFSSCAPSTVQNLFLSLAWHLTSLWATSRSTSLGRHHNQTTTRPPAGKRSRELCVARSWPCPLWRRRTGLPFLCKAPTAKESKHSKRPNQSVLTLTSSIFRIWSQTEA